jgi:hypothetical protein
MLVSSVHATPLYIEGRAARVIAKQGTMHGNDSANATLSTDTRLGAGEKRLGLGPLALPRLKIHQVRWLDISISSSNDSYGRPIQNACFNQNFVELRHSFKVAWRSR